MRNADLTVHVSTKLNRSHVVTGREALILPALGRSEQDLTGGRVQRVTVEDSMSAVHASHGPLEAGVAAPEVRGRHRLLARRWPRSATGTASRGRRSAPTTPRSGTGSPGWCRAARRTTRRSSRPGGFVLPHPPRDSRTFPTEAGKAMFTTSPTDVLHVPEGRLLLQTLRSHDQFNTTIYGLDDRYRGIKNGRRVVFVHPDDIAALGLRGRLDRRPGQRVVGRVRAPRAGVPGGALRPAARLRGGVLPGDESPGPAGIHRHRQQLPDVEVGDRPARAARAAEQGVEPATPARSRAGDDEAAPSSREHTAHEQPRGQAAELDCVATAGRPASRS